MEEIFNYKKQIILSLIIVLVVSIVLFCIFINKKESNTKIVKEIKEDEEIIDKEEDNDEQTTFYVDIKGEIVNPGVYNIVKNSIVNDVIVLAGGLTKNADTTCVNLSKKITDEMVIYINSKSEIKKLKEENKVTVNKEIICNDIKNDAYIALPEDKTDTSITTPTTNKINLNTATLDILVTLPGIGEDKARKIIEYREQNNGFKTIEELKNINGIGDSTFDKLKDLITV